MTTGSQFGEVKLISDALTACLGNSWWHQNSSRRWIVDVGAGDGVEASNSLLFRTIGGFNSLLIEADMERHAKLAATCQNGNARSICRKVSFAPPNDLDTILAEYGVPKDFDVLSIDIDGCDYYVWEAMNNYSPCVVCIEFNPTIPNEVEYIQERDLSINRGASPFSLAAMGHTKGYDLFGVTHCNLVFAKRDLWSGRPTSSAGTVYDRLRMLRTDLSAITWLFSGYDGHVMLHGNRSLIWHDVPMPQDRMQPLPDEFQKYPPNFTPREKKLFDAWRR